MTRSPPPLSPPLLPLLLLWMLASGAGCTARAARVGLIDTDRDRLELVEPSGRITRLIADDYAAELRYLDGCIVEVVGPQVARRLYVRHWKVTDAGDGSEPFVGTLRRVGARWALEDWNSGFTVFLEPAALATSQLPAAAGQPVLIVGYVVGAQEVAVLSWRLLSAAPPEE